ncbi:hypothetical protein JWG44_05390 [Leptospira sp. 201903071]|uniref:hypothetical protein n=1 Tax=Leptospira ainazelensis TaxID=2810034 RepID=UPI001965EA52|nr:hypothetical protein [Leptospira ainazelensis]MBM9499683.1 hypothetical protein [Leptospira ainazelensis]
MEFRAVILIADGNNGNPKKEDVSIKDRLPVYFGNATTPISSNDSQFGELKSTEWEGDILIGTFTIHKLFPAIEGIIDTDSLKHTITGVRLSISPNQDERILPIQNVVIISKSIPQDKTELIKSITEGLERSNIKNECTEPKPKTIPIPHPSRKRISEK